MGNQRDRQFTLPKNIRQMGQFGDTYKIYVEDFVYTYVHRTLHMENRNMKSRQLFYLEKPAGATIRSTFLSVAHSRYLFRNGDKLMKQIRCSILQKMI